MLLIKIVYKYIYIFNNDLKRYLYQIEYFATKTKLNIIYTYISLEIKL